MKFNDIIILAALITPACVTINNPVASEPFTQCSNDPAKQEMRSKELQDIVKADQNDREIPADKIKWDQVTPRDEARRKRVGEIFGEGCFKNEKDYSAAALIYQHGNVPDHFLQTFLWAKKAVELGDSSQSRLMAMGLDRYLVNTGHKQLFATQASKAMNNCWCLEEVEKSYPEKERIKIAQKSVQDALKWIDSLNNNQASCKPAKFCQKDLKESKRGIVPGFW